MQPTSPAVFLILALAGCFPAVDLSISEGEVGGADTGGDGPGDDTGGRDDTGEDPVTLGDLEVSPATVDFGLVFLGRTETATLTIFNKGEGEAKVELEPGGEAASTLELIPPLARLEPGASSEHTVFFTPNAWGTEITAEIVVLDTLTEASVAVPVTAAVQEDGDGDGVGSTASGGEDCDDEDASINPSAEEVWYDGVDSDCDGADDDDADGDGVPGEAAGGTDCDDTDASVSPEQAETWYDGVDADCDGGSDYDADSDGHDTADWGGTDCDDANASVNPDADETWYDGVDADCDGASDYDADGDGHDSDDWGGADCDDGDAGVNPDASETWYDGVDADCDGADDYDADGDGDRAEASGGTDCDDTDSSVYGGASDTWYDGVDSDCDGASDYDADADGYDSDAWGGTDCDDGDASVSPGASETWYDGTDSDCDGASDYDADADGYDSDAWGGTDCDDGDADVNPGEAEVWYDGTDADCDGASDYDADGDGLDSADHSSSGTDCDDTDASIGAPTDETLNSVDDDCDGTVDNLAVSDAMSGVLYGPDADLELGHRGSFALLDDVTGDGAVDLFAISQELDEGYAWLVDGSTASTASGDIDTVDSANMEGASAAYTLAYVLAPTADEDGDGTAELLLGTTSTTGWYSNYGAAAFWSGGSGISGTLDPTAYDAAFSGNSQSDNLRLAALGDVDGDGYADVVGGARYDSTYSTSTWRTQHGVVGVWGGGSLSDWSYMSDADDSIIGSSGYDYLGQSLTLADLDGDGYVDIVVGAPGDDDGASNAGAVYIFSGNASLSWSSAADSAASTKITGSGASDALGEDALPPAGDVDGDGDLDLMLPSEDEGEAWLFLSAGGLGSSVSASSADHTFSGTAGDFASAAAIDSDLDGDGADEIAIGGDSSDVSATDSGVVYLYFYDSGWGSSLGSSDADATIWGDDSGDYLGTGLAGGQDLDGDGLEDLLFGAVGVDDGASEGGALYVIPGW